ncbi:MAG: rhamnogalacturonan lyase, partial [Bacteroidaceae bacterium]|nr:rhamnogalacturonan lyase [Bacteroidaceae bacterium]
MKRFVFSLLLTSLVLSSAFAQVTPTSQMEKLDRGLVVVKQSTSKKLLSWRFLGTDDWQTTFDVLKDGEVIATDLTATNYSVNDYGTTVGSYQVVAKVNGEEVDRSNIATGWSDYFLPVKLNRPANASNASGSYSYSPNDCSVGDVDGDGQYEIFVKWDPSNSKDNSQGGYTGNVYLDCYKFDLNGVEPAQMLWRIDLGVNIRAGAHYTQFMVYDFDGDGKAELMCKTAPGSKDGQGNYVNQAATVSAIKSASNTKDWRNSDGRVNGGQEYLTVFNGETGAAIHTIAYNPNRNATNALSEAEGTFNWGTNGKNDKGSYGNRGERYLAAVAYLDGPDKRPSGIFSRGYYTFAYIWAVDFDGEKLTQKWFHASDSPTSYKLTTGTSSTRTFTPGAPTGRKSGSR